MAGKTTTSIHTNLTADAGKLLKEFEKVRKETKLLRKTVEDTANRTKYAFNKLRRAAQVVASAFIFAAGIRRLGMLGVAIAKASDKVALMEARFQQFARASDPFIRVYRLSKTLGQSLESTADGMTRLLVATKDIGTAQPVLEKVYQNIVLLGRAGGTSAEEMTGAMRQLSQGLASGRLQGEELRSVLENFPLVAVEIADQMDIALGQIRAVAAEGKITPSVIVAALEEIGIKMEDLPQTWSMQTENLRTEWDLFLNDLSQAVDEAGLLEDLVEAVRWVRMEVLGSLQTTPTDVVEGVLGRRQRDLATTSLALQARGVRVTDLEGNPLEKLSKLQSGLKGLALGSFDETRRLIDLYNSLSEEVAKYNAELEKRRKTEEMIQKSKDAADELRQSIKDELIDELTIETGLDRKLREAGMLDPNKQFDVFATTMNKDWWENAGEGIAALGRHIKEVMPPAAQLMETLAQIRKDAALTDEQGNPLFSPEEIAERAAAAAATYNKSMAKLRDDADEADEAWKELGATFESAFENAIVEGEKLRDVLRGILQDILRIMVREWISKPLFGAVAKFFGKKEEPEPNAMGGPVRAGGAYLIGEKGPELWSPSRSGYILPNSSLQGGGMVIAPTINIDSRTDRAQVEALVYSGIIQAASLTEAKMRNDQREGRF